MKINYKSVIWDWNGTLLDDSWLCVEVLNSLLNEIGAKEISINEYRDNFEFPVINFYKYLQFKTDPKNFKKISHKFIARYEARCLKECKLHPEVGDTLMKISDMGVSQFILSAAHSSALNLGLSHFKIKTFFESFIGTNNIYAEGKIENAKKWIADSSRAPGEIILIGDTLHDYEVAQAIGAHCALIPNGHCSLDRLKKSNAKIIKSANSVLSFLKG